jgi:phosphoribosylformylglycinamidine cyclo-ligase
MASACRENGLALIGGESAEMPGMYAEGEYDAAGFIVGTVAPDRYFDGSLVKEGDALIGLPSAGLHTNGYSLARHILGLTGDHTVDQSILNQPLPGGAGLTVGAALMQPHLSYLPAVQPLIARGLVHGIAHITGGGLTDNVPRMLPKGLAARFDPSTWSVPPIFDYLVQAGSVSNTERYRAFNMGIGLVLAVAKNRAADVIDQVSEARVIGQVIPKSREDEPVVQGLIGGERHDG